MTMWKTKTPRLQLRLNDSGLVELLHDLHQATPPLGRGTVAVFTKNLIPGDTGPFVVLLDGHQVDLLAAYLPEATISERYSAPHQHIARRDEF